MAKIDPLKYISGSVGDVIIYKRGEKYYMRAKPKVVHQPNTEAQILTREKFKQASALAKSLFRLHSHLGCEVDASVVKSNYHNLLGLIRNSGFKSNASTLIWNWETLCISKGSLDIPEIIKSKNENVCTFTWDLKPSISERDEFIFVSIDKKTLHTESLVVPVSESKLRIELNSDEVIYVVRHQIMDEVFYLSSSSFLV